MQTTHKIPGSSAVRFARYLLAEAARGDYYTHDGEATSPPTQWHGPEELLRRFGIDPEKPVELRHFGPLMQGFHPVTQQADPPGRIERHQDRWDQPQLRAAEGSLSAVGDDRPLPPCADRGRPPQGRQEHAAAHREGGRDGATQDERGRSASRRPKACWPRRSFTRPAARARTRTRRDPRPATALPHRDPRRRTKDGTIAAVESRQIMQAARENGAWYRSQLAANLQELGIGIERHQGNGERYFGVRGVSKELSERWSTRAPGRPPRRQSLPADATAASPDPESSTQSPSPPAGRRPPRPQRRSTPRGARSARSTTSPRKRSEEAFHDWGLHVDPNVNLAEELLVERHQGIDR